MFWNFHIVSMTDIIEYNIIVSTNQRNKNVWIKKKKIITTIYSLCDYWIT